MQLLVSTDWLADEMDASDLRIIDATKFLPDMGRHALDEYVAGHIPGAIFMDMEDLSDPGSDLPGMLPKPEHFASRMQDMGLGDGSRIVLYDNSPLHSSARAWWMLKVYGAQHVAILDGGLAKWKAEGRPLDSGCTDRKRRHFTAWMDRTMLRDKEQVLANIKKADAVVVDARPAERFAGRLAEPRPGLAAGHIPGSCNIPHDRLFHADGTWKQGDALRQVFENAGIDLGKPLITSCGSGVTAAVILFGAQLLGKRDIALYDGSWAEWGLDPETPKRRAD